MTYRKRLNGLQLETIFNLKSKLGNHHATTNAHIFKAVVYMNTYKNRLREFLTKKRKKVKKMV